MTFLQIIILSLVQAFTEFLPVSSSGHLNLFQSLLSLTPSLSFDIFLNSATLLSVLYYFRHHVKEFAKNLPLITIASVPAAVAGIFFKDYFEAIFARLDLTPFFFLFSGLIIYLTRHSKIQKSARLNWKTALIIGFLQSIAILPGVSRSGSTISTALLLGLSPAVAFNFSFFLFIPASLGALILELKDLNFSAFLSPVYLVGFVVTFLLGIVALKLLKQIVTSKNFYKFSYYLFALSFVLMFYFTFLS